MHVNEMLREKEAILAESDGMKRLLNTFKVAGEVAERKIKELTIKESIAVEERNTQREYFKKRIRKISGDYIEAYRLKTVEFEKYKEFIMVEVEVHEQVREGLEVIIKMRDIKIADLSESLSIPRAHFKYIERLTAEETIK